MPTDSTDRLDTGLVRLGMVLLVGAMAALLNTTVVAVALPEMSRAFGVSLTSVQWVTTANLLAMVMSIPAMGWLVDRFGSRRVWLGSTLLFFVGTTLCAAAWSLPALVAFRVVQGIGAGLVLPLVHAILADAAGPARVGRAMAMVGIPGQLAPVLGPVLGAGAVSLAGWPGVFLATAPVSAVALLLAWWMLPDGSGSGAAELDGRGLLLTLPAVVGIVYGLTVLGRGWSWVGALAFLSGVLFSVLFVRHARVLGERALVDLSLLSRGTYRAAAMMMFMFGFALYGPMFVLPVYVEQVLGGGAGVVGLLLALQGVGTAVSLALVGRWVDRSGPRVPALSGIVLAAASTVVFMMSGPLVPIAVLGAAALLLGVGLAAAGTAGTAASYRALVTAEIPRATSMLHVIQRMGAVVGTAGLATVLSIGSGSGQPASATTIAVAFGLTALLALVGLLPARTLPAGPPLSNVRRVT